MILLLAAVCASATIANEPARLLVVNQGDKTISVVDPDALKQIAVIDQRQTTMHGHEIAVGPDRNIAFLPIFGSTGVGSPGLDGSEMLAIDWKKGKIVGKTDFGKGVRPHCVVYEPKKKLLYVTTELDDSITLVDPKSYKVVGHIPTGAKLSHMVAISRDGKRGYTSNVSPGSVSVLDLDQKKLVKVIPISNYCQRVSTSWDGRWVFTSDHVNKKLIVIDAKRMEIHKQIDMPGNGFGSAPTPDGKWLLVPIPSMDKVVVIDVKTMTISKQIAVGKNPQEILVRPNGKFAYVAAASEKKLCVIDLQEWKMSATVEVGNYPDGLAWAE